MKFTLERKLMAKTQAAKTMRPHVTSTIKFHYNNEASRNL